MEQPLPPISTEREESPIRNLSAYPRFTLVPAKAMDTYTSTKSFVTPRRARSCERYDVPRKTLPDTNPLVEMPQRRERSPSPARRLSITYPTAYEDDNDVSPKVFDTYARYARTFANNKPVSTVSKLPFDPYLSLLRQPRSYSYDKYYPLDIDYDTYRYLRAKSPFLPEASVTSTPLYRTYKIVPERSYLLSPNYVPAYPYTQRYVPSVVNYPVTYRTYTTSALSPATRIWI